MQGCNKYSESAKGAVRHLLCKELAYAVLRLLEERQCNLICKSPNFYAFNTWDDSRQLIHQLGALRGLKALEDACNV